MQFVLNVGERNVCGAMNSYKAIGWIVIVTAIGLGLMSWGEVRVVKKNKLKDNQLQEHVIDWATDQIHNIRCMVDMLNDSDLEDGHRSRIFDDIAEQLVEILDLLEPIDHDKTMLFDWAERFIKDNLMQPSNEH